ncbi:MAG: hypothetical protein RR444_00125 [Oscillospiraceae bacterium]
MLLSSNIQIASSFGQTINIVLGKEQDIGFTLSNSSATQKAYNVSADLILSDGLSLVSSTPQYTSSTTSAANKTSTFTITNFKDFAPLEGNFSLNYVIESLLQYLNGNPIPFGSSISGNLNVYWDSMPRGSYDAGNIQYYNIFSFSVTVSQLSITMTLPSKRVKGAGDQNTAATKLFTNLVTIINNDSIPSTFSISDSLPNGFCYLGNFTIVTPSYNQLSTPTSTIDSQSGLQTLSWSNFTLLSGETIAFSYQAAIYDNYATATGFNTGTIIEHGTVLSSTISAIGNGFSASDYYSITAMDIVISVAQDQNIVDCNDTINYIMGLEANQYHDMTSVLVSALVPDGQSPTSYPNGVVGTVDSNYNIPVSYTVGGLAKNTTTQRYLACVVLLNYRSDSSLVACGDNFTLQANVTGINSDTSDNDSDSASISQSIILPNITKTIIGKYYCGLQPKTIPALAPYDYIKYQLSYDSTGIQAAQLNILLDDFFPLDTILPTISNITQITGPTITPQPIDPNGLRWTLGNVPTGTVWTVTVMNQISSTIQSNYPINLFKLNGQNHIGQSYSNRTNVNYNYGVPNILIARSISGINVNAVQSLQQYTASITYTNTQNAALTTTDAFNFTAYATISGGIIVNPSSITITGTGSWNTPDINGDILSFYINSLYVGQSITLSYQATIPANIPPSYSASVSSQLEIPYTQTFNIQQSNVKYDIAALMTNITLRSVPIVMTKSYDTGIKQVGSTVNYSINVTIPQGTAVYAAALEDTLNSKQSYVGNATYNGSPVTVTSQNNTVTFPSQAYIYNANTDTLLTYGFTAQINDALTTSTDVIQQNNCSFHYQDNAQNPYSSTAYVNVTVSNPNLSLIMSGANNQLSSSAPTTISLAITNTGRVTATGISASIALPPNTLYVSSSSSTGLATYNALTNTINFSLATLLANQTATITYSIKGISTVNVEDTATLIGQSGTYTNNITQTKVYPSVNSNAYVLTAEPAVLLTIYPPYRSLSGNGFVLVTANSIAIVPYTLVNQGGGIDSFSLAVSTSKYPYNITVNDAVIASVAANSAYSGSPTAFSNIPSGNMVQFQLVFAVPSVQLYDRNPYTVSATSLSNEAVTATNHTDMVDP